MPSLVTRFHLLIFWVTLGITGVAILHVPESFAFPAHWQGMAADWLWPRNLALAVAPLLQLLLMAAFFALGLALTKNHLAKTRHIFDPAITLLLAIPASCQLGLLLSGIGSDIDLFRITAFGLAATMLILAAVLLDVGRHTYGGLRMPWPIPSDRSFLLVHRSSAVAALAVAIGLAWFAWTDPGPGPLVLGMALSLVFLPLFAGLVSLATRRL